MDLHVACRLPILAVPHEDAADLFLAATARASELTLITADRNLIKTQGISVLATQYASNYTFSIVTFFTTTSLAGRSWRLRGTSEIFTTTS